MTLLEIIKNDLKVAMLTNKIHAKEALRVVLGEVPRLNKKAGEEVTDEDMLQILRNLKKSELDTLEKEDRTSSNFLQIINKYLPVEPTEEAVVAWVKENVDLESLGNIGKAVPIVVAHFKNAITGKKVNEYLRRMQ